MAAGNTLCFPEEGANSLPTTGSNASDLSGRGCTLQPLDSHHAMKCASYKAAPQAVRAYKLKAQAALCTSCTLQVTTCLLMKDSSLVQACGIESSYNWIYLKHASRCC